MTEEEKRHQKELWKQDRIRERREEWQKIRSLGFKARIGYFWDYYKIVLVIIAALILVIFLIVSIIQGMRTDTLLYVCVLNSDELDPDTERLRDDYIEARGGTGKMQEIVFDSSIEVDPDSPGISQRDVAASIKITSYVSAGAVDVFLSPSDVTEFEKEQGLFMELDDLLSEEEIERLSESGCLYYAAAPDPETEDTAFRTETVKEEGQRFGENALNTVPGKGQHIYAVRADQAGVLGRYGIYDDDRPVWFSIIGNSSRTEEAVRLLHFLLGEQDQEKSGGA